MFTYILTNTEGSAAKTEHNLGEGDHEMIQCQNFTEGRKSIKADNGLGRKVSIKTKY